MPRLAPMQFKEFVWPHNPTTYEIKFIKDIAEHRFLNKNGAEQEDLGMGARVFFGSGIFFGPDAYKTFGALASVYYQKGPGNLIHPIWMPTTAIFSKLDLKQEPRPDYVEYTFEFVEHKEINIIKEVVKTPSGSSVTSEKKTSNGVTHTVKQGETLSYIGSLYGVPWRQIATDNAKLIKDPNLIQIGWKLTINNPSKVPSSTAKPASTKAPDPVASDSNSKKPVVNGMVNDKIPSLIEWQVDSVLNFNQKRVLDLFNKK